MIQIKLLKPLSLVLCVFIIFACSSTDEEDTEQITVTKEKLVGEWKLISSTIDNKNVSPPEFNCLKNSTAKFDKDGTYKLAFLKLGSGSTNLCSKTTTLSGTYTVIGLNTVTFFNSNSEIKLIDDTLQITSRITSDDQEQNQVDTFIRNDNTELEETNEEESDNVETEMDSDGEENSTFDGTEVIQKILGRWKIDADQDCFQKNTIEFKPQAVFEFIQHQKTFNRRDLLNYNVSVSYPLPENIKATVTKGHDMVVFDTSEECQFIKTSTLEYIVKDEKTIVLKDISSLKIVLQDNETIKLIYTFIDSDNSEREREFIYKKEMI